MPETEINYKPKIFDDPEFCENESGRCKKLGHESEDYCYCFDRLINFTPNYEKKKHDECKKYYQEANGGANRKQS